MMFHQTRMVCHRLRNHLRQIYGTPCRLSSRSRRLWSMIRGPLWTALMSVILWQIYGGGQGKRARRTRLVSITLDCDGHRYSCITKVSRAQNSARRKYTKPVLSLVSSLLMASNYVMYLMTVMVSKFRYCDNLADNFETWSKNKTNTCNTLGVESLSFLQRCSQKWGSFQVQNVSLRRSTPLRAPWGSNLWPISTNGRPFSTVDI